MTHIWQVSYENDKGKFSNYFTDEAKARSFFEGVVEAGRQKNVAITHGLVEWDEPEYASV